jgi:microcompartment protein CcmK/EutM
VSVTYEVSAAFVLAEEITVTAEDLGYGLERGFLKPPDVVALAADEMGSGADDAVLVALGSLLRYEEDRVPEVLELLHDPEGMHDPCESARKIA